MSLQALDHLALRGQVGLLPIFNIRSAPHVTKREGTAISPLQLSHSLSASAVVRVIRDFGRAGSRKPAHSPSTHDRQVR